MRAQMEIHEFDNIGELEDVQNGLARASRHPLHIDFGTEFDEGGVAPLSQLELGGDAATRLAELEPMQEMHAVWNNRDDGLAYLGSERYNLIQHREVIDAIRDAVGATTGSIEKGVVRDYGPHVDGVLVFGDQDDAIIDVRELVGDGYVPPEGDDWYQDRLGLGMRFHNSFNGRSGYGGTSMAYRFICGNWMVWGEEAIESKSSYHIKSEREAPGVSADYFEAVIGAVFEQRDPLAGVVKDSIEEGEMPVEWAPAVLDDAGFGKNYQKRIAARLLVNEPGPETTLWDVYNAATGYIDNERVGDLGPERYDHHQASAWAVLETEPREPDVEMDSLEEFATGATA